MDIAHLPDLHPHTDRGSLNWCGVEDVPVLHVSKRRVIFNGCHTVLLILPSLALTTANSSRIGLVLPSLALTTANSGRIGLFLPSLALTTANSGRIGLVACVALAVLPFARKSPFGTTEVGFATNTQPPRMFGNISPQDTPDYSHVEREPEEKYLP
jgi:hypothetical protein